MSTAVQVVFDNGQVAMVEPGLNRVQPGQVFLLDLGAELVQFALHALTARFRFFIDVFQAALEQVLIQGKVLGLFEVAPGGIGYGKIMFHPFFADDFSIVGRQFDVAPVIFRIGCGILQPVLQDRIPLPDALYRIIQAGDLSGYAQIINTDSLMIGVLPGKVCCRLGQEHTDILLQVRDERVFPVVVWRQVGQIIRIQFKGVGF